MGSRYGMQIRTASAEDAVGLAELLAMAGMAASAGEVAVRLAALSNTAGSALVAMEWGPPSGVIAVQWGPTLFSAHPIAWISTLIVRPDDRRRGIGRTLLKAASQAARQAGCDEMRLAALKDHEGLLEFARSTGFEAGASILTRALRKRS